MCSSDLDYISQQTTHLTEFDESLVRRWVKQITIWDDRTTVDTAARDEQIKRINDLQDYISQQTAHLTEFDESLVRRWVKQITIWDDHTTVELKSGLSIDIQA